MKLHIVHKYIFINSLSSITIGCRINDCLIWKLNTSKLKSIEEEIIFYIYLERHINTIQ